jgi:hypothetical protein
MSHWDSKDTLPMVCPGTVGLMVVLMKAMIIGIKLLQYSKYTTSIFVEVMQIFHTRIIIIHSLIVWQKRLVIPVTDILLFMDLRATASLCMVHGNLRGLLQSLVGRKEIILVRRLKPVDGAVVLIGEPVC